MKLWLVFSLLITTISAAPRKVVLQEWNNFKEAHGKTYADKNEEMIRLKTFWNNRRIVQHHNKRFDKGKTSYQLSMNHFGDLLESELVAYRGFRSGRDVTGSERYYAKSDITDLPASVDWREKGAVTPVKNQGKCGSCYTFASIGALESHNYLSTGELIPLSEQNAIDCTQPYGNGGCNGGYRYTIFEYVRDNGGVDTEESYPYQGIACNYCRYKPKYKTVNCTGYVFVEEGSEIMLQSAVAQVGPVATGIDCGKSFHFYKSGIYHEPCCTPDSTNHAVLIVGYGTTADGKDYWIIKNSWGTEWGEDGYIKMPRHLNNHCAVALTPCYPIVK